MRRLNSKYLKYFLITLLALAKTVDAKAAVPLEIGIVDSNKYGYNFEGVMENRSSAMFTFENIGSDLTLNVSGFDLDAKREVAVYINGVFFEYLKRSSDNGTSLSIISISQRDQIDDSNLIEFRQRRPGWTWGVTQLSLNAVQTIALSLGIVDRNKYGYKFDGVWSQKNNVTFSFEHQDVDLTLQIAGYDIDFNDEVSIWLNTRKIGTLGISGDLQLGLTTISITAEDQTPGLNLVEFRQKRPKWRWGVTDILLQPSTMAATTLKVDILETTEFGFGFNGVNSHRAGALFAFVGTGSDMALDVSGYDIDGSTEVKVFVNDKRVGNLSISGNETSANSLLAIPLSIQVSGTNFLEFRQRVPGFIWGVTDLLLSEQQSSAKPSLENYQLVFNDEFNAPPGSTLDRTKWDTGLLWGPYFAINNEEQFYVDTLGMHSGFHHSPFEFTGSTLKITATPTSSNLQPPPRPDIDDPVWKPRRYSEYRYNGPTPEGPGYQESDVKYLSGMITTYDSLKMAQGYIEMRAKLPAGRGLWPAFWALTTHYVEDVPEIDVMELLGQDTDRIYNTYHYFDISDNWRKISTPSFPVYSSDWTQNFHTFGMAWSRTEIIWYVDGIEANRISSSELKIPNQSMYILANLAVGGNWPGPPDSSTVFPATFEIDYIRAYDRKTSPTLDLVNDYRLMFEDNFNGSTLDASKWKTSFLWGPYLPINDEEQYLVDALGSDAAQVTPSNTPFVLNNGVLSITARKADDPNSFPIPETLPDINAPIWSNYWSYNRNENYSPGNYTSGIITSYESFKFVHGYVEIRARIPKGRGLWPAFWLLNSYYVGPQPEIDIFEILGDKPYRAYHTFHRSDINGVPLQSQGITPDYGVPSIGYADNFHTYGLRWQRGRLEWYIDGSLVHTYEGEDVPYQLMYVLADVAVGGSWPGPPDSTTQFPAKLDIDYIRVYQERPVD